MTTTAAPTAPVSAGDAAPDSTAARSGDSPRRLDYATPWPRYRLAPSARAQRMFWHAVRKTVFAGGLGLLVYGLASVAGDVNRHTAPVAAAWGVAFVVLMLPGRLLARRTPKRRRRRRAAPPPPSGI